MKKRMIFLSACLALGLTVLAGQAQAQQQGPELEAALIKAYTNWRDAIIRKDAQAWAATITRYRQVMIRNEIVSNKESFPEAVFDLPGTPPALHGLKLLEAQAIGTTAHLVYYGKVDVGQERDQMKDTVMKLKFGLENGAWRYDSNRFTDLDNVPAVRKALQSGQKPDFLDLPEFNPPGSFPAVPALCRVPDHKGGFKLQSFGYETSVLMNGFKYDAVEDALDQQVILGGLVKGANEITLRMKPVPTPEGQKRVMQIRVYKLDVTAPDKPGVEVLRWEAPAGGAPKEITLPFSVN